MSDNSEPPFDQEYRESLPLINEILAFVCHRSRFSREDCEDFKQEVHLKLIDHDYRVLRERSGASLRSYLKVVILRAGQDYRNHLWGKHRDTAEAQRLGKAAVHLERLITRDGLSNQEAVRFLRTNEKIEVSDEELEEIFAHLRLRPRKQWLPEELLGNFADPAAGPDVVLRSKDAANLKAKILDLLQHRVARLSSDQQILFKMLFEEGFSIAQIARARNLPQKPLYADRDRALRQLREGLEVDGIRKEDLKEIFRLLLGSDEPGEPDQE